MRIRYNAAQCSSLPWPTTPTIDNSATEFSIPQLRSPPSHTEQRDVRGIQLHSLPAVLLPAWFPIPEPQADDLWLLHQPPRLFPASVPAKKIPAFASTRSRWHHTDRHPA